MDRTTDDETEVKLDAGLDVDLPDLREVVRPGRRTTHDLVASYVDTPSLDLHRRGITLRRRTGGSDAGWHLKLPREGDTRTEERAPLGASATRVPTELRALVADVVEKRPLLPVVTLRTRRAERKLHGEPEGDPARALLADDLVVAEPPGAGWREVEVELTDDGDEAFLERVVDTLVGSGWQRSDSPSKYSRAVGLLPERREPDLSPNASAADVVLAYLHEQIGAIQAREAELRDQDPDAVHKTRVATRRLRTTLRVFRRLLQREQTDPFRDELRWYAHALGEVRDLDVVREHLLDEVEHLPEADRGPARERIEATLDGAHGEACDRLDRAMDSQRFTDLADALVSLGADPPWRGRASRTAKKVLPDLVDDATERVERWSAAARATADPGRRRDLQHETRKKAKAVRYAHEAMALAWGRPEKEQARQWEAVTESLGAMQDTVTAREWLARISEAARARGESTSPFEVLVERAEQQGRDAAGTGEDALTTASVGSA